MRLVSEGVETFESCEGGAGHGFPEPTVRFEGNTSEGLRALSVALTYGLPVFRLRRTWGVVDGLIHGTLVGDDIQTSAQTFTQLVQLFTVLATPVSASAIKAIFLWYLTARTTLALIVVNAVLGGFVSFINRVKRGYFSHRSYLPCLLDLPTAGLLVIDAIGRQKHPDGE